MLINESQVKWYVDTLFSQVDSGFIECRFIHNRNGRYCKNIFFPIGNHKQEIIKALQRWHIHLGEEFHCFMGVNVRGSQDGHENNISYVTTFFADVDAKDFESKGKALQSIYNFDLIPTFLVSSGNGYHCYYVLKEPINVESKEAHGRCKTISHIIHGEVNGDSTMDLSRILRIPSTYNVKSSIEPKKTTNDRRQWKKCKILNKAGQRYSIDKIEEVLPDKDIDFGCSHDTITITNLDDNYDDSLIDEVNNITKFRAKKYWTEDRSVKDYYIIKELYDQGFTEKEIVDIFYSFAERGYDCTNKWLEVGHSYLERTISRAKD